MLKRMLAILLVLAMVMTVLPFSVFADDETSAEGTAENPIILPKQNTINVDNTGTMYYATSFAGTMILTISGANFSVTYNGTAHAPVNGAVALEVTSASTSTPVVFAITGEGQYTINFAAPTGTVDSPAALVIGENTATIAAGDVDGYIFSYTATQAGVLSILMTEDNWMYSIDKTGSDDTVQSVGPYYSNDTDTVPISSVEVAAGDEIRVTVSTFDPVNPNVAPAGTLKFTATFPEALGTENNPYPLHLGENVAQIEEGSYGFCYTWTAHADGTLTITMPEGGNWWYELNNVTADAWGETTYSNAATNTQSIDVAEGDEILFIVSTYDYELQGAVEGELPVEAYFTAVSGSIGNPILIEGDVTVTVPAGQTIYYMGRLKGKLMSAVGAGVTLTHNDQSYALSNTATTFECYQEDLGGNPELFVLTNTTSAAVTVTMTIIVPKGTRDNPATLVVGNNTAVIEEGNNQGYYFYWMAPKDCTLYLLMPAGNWQYYINNLSTGAYGAIHTSADAEVQNCAAIQVSAYDELQIVVNSYNPDEPHSYPAATLVIKATVDCAHSYTFKDNEDKTHTATCGTCGHNYTEEHSYTYHYDANNKCTGATCECGDTLFVMGNSAVTLKELLQLDMLVAKANIVGTDNYAILTRTYKNSTEVHEVRVDQEFWSSYDDNRWAISYTQLAAKEMNDEVTIVIYNAKGQQLSVAHTDTIRAYMYRALKGLANVTDAKNVALRTLVVDVLNYGAYAQQQFNYDTGNLVNAAMTDAQKAWGTQTNATVTNVRELTQNAVTTTVSLQSAVRMDFMFNTDALGSTEAEWENLYAVATYTNHRGEAKTVRVEGSAFAPYYRNNVLCVQVGVTGMAAADYQQLVTCVVYNANNEAIASCNDTIGGYTARARAAGATGTVGALSECLAKYCASAYKYFHM